MRGQRLPRLWEGERTGQIQKAGASLRLPRGVSPTGGQLVELRQRAGFPWTAVSCQHSETAPLSHLPHLLPSS